MWRRALAAILVAAVVAGCSGDEPKQAQKRKKEKVEAQTFETIDSPSMQFLPRQEEVPGWRLEGDPLVFPADKIVTYLDREARHPLLYDALDLTVGEYKRGDGPAFATVMIFRFPDFVKAFGAYSTKRTGVLNYLDIGNESFIAPHSIHVWRGPFYVHIIGGGSPQVIDQMKLLASAIVDRMPSAPGKPSVFGFFPEKYRLVNSETFSAGPGFGQPYLANSFGATFDVEGERVEGLILPAPTKEAAVKIVDQYRAFFAANGRLLDPIPNLGEDNFTGEDRFVGRTVAFRLDRFVIAFKGYGDKQKLIDLAILTDQRILGTIRAALTAEPETEAEPPKKVPLP